MAVQENAQNNPSYADNARNDEATLRGMIARWSRALEAKDVAGMLADYAPDAVLYDAIPPYKTVGVENIRKVWESCLPYFPASFVSEHRDLIVHVNGDTAFVFGLHHFVPKDADHPCGQTWMRVTAGYRRVGESWKVVHEHVSVPFNPMDSKAWMIHNPDVVDMPDYAGACS